jgi:hypothetical protein
MFFMFLVGSGFLLVSLGISLDGDDDDDDGVASG